MRIHSSMFQPSSVFAKSGQTQAHRAAEQPTTPGNRIRDKADISPRGKLMSSIQQLSDQKKSLLESKRNLISRTMEEGGDMKAIEGQLDVYTQQMDEIDKQVSQLTADYAKQMAEKATQQSEKKKSSDKVEPSTDVDVQRLTDLASAADKVQQAESVAALQNKVDSSAKIQDAEIHLDKLEIGRNEYKEKFDNANLKHVITRMKADVKVQEGESFSRKLLAKDMEQTVSDQLKAVVNQSEESSSAKTEGTATEDTSAKTTESAAAPEVTAAPSTPSTPTETPTVEA